LRKLDVLHDLRFAIRMFRKNAGFTLTAVFTIALGISASTAIFSVVNAVLLRQLPYEAPDRLVILSERDVSSPGMDNISFASARAYRERSRTLESLLQYNDSDG
jgi:putative ABC transport system permease protein